MKMNHYLKTGNEAALWTALRMAGLLKQTYNQAGDVVSEHPIAGVDLDIIGTIHVRTDTVDEKGMPIMEAIDGFHANLLADLTPQQLALLPTIPAPTNPVRVWAE